MNIEWWKNKVPRALANRHPFRYVRARIGDVAPGLLMRLHDSRRSPRDRTSPLTGRWWDTSDDETLLWPENEHIKRSHRMQELEQGLDKLRDTRSGPRFTD